jgi:hypothetical protein
MYRVSIRGAAALGLAAVASLAMGTTHIAAATTGAPGAAPACGESDVSQLVRTGHHRYAPGQRVTITVIAKNRTSHNCALPGTVRAGIHGPGGGTVWESATGISWIPEKTWRPGTSIRWTFTWGQEDCSKQPCSTVSPGTYVAQGSWGTYVSSSATFVINGKR